jgi:hypothetical protein
VKPEPTFGESRVRLETYFNSASVSKLIEEIKRKTADLIDLCYEQYAEGHPESIEAGRLWHLAMTHYENAVMWAVKAATTPKGSNHHG